MMGISLALARGTALAATVMFAFALLKRMIIVFGLLFAVVKFAIVIAFITLIVSIAIAIIRDRSGHKPKAETL